jgi:hypothetical protein
VPIRTFNDGLAVQLSRLEFPVVVNLQHFPDLSAIFSDGVVSIFLRCSRRRDTQPSSELWLYANPLQTFGQEIRCSVYRIDPLHAWHRATRLTVSQ